jgi:putative ABC transport system permease protein
MFRNYLTVAIRHLTRQKLYSLINVLSLSIGIACVILIVLFVQDEVGYDQHHEKSDRIYRIIRETELNGGGSKFHEGASGLLAPTIREELPDVERVARAWTRWGHLRYEDNGFTQTVCLADPELLEILTFPLIDGDPHALRDRPGSAFITSSLAEKYFPQGDPIGKVLTFEEKYFGGDYVVAGILEDIPKRATLQFDALIATFPNVGHTHYHWSRWKQRHIWFPVATYLLLPDDASIPSLVERLNAMMTTHMGTEVSDINAYHLQPLERVHLYSKVDYEITWYGDIEGLYTLGMVALFILLNACINFTNLATARGFSRAREVGLRKVMGGQRAQLIRQFLGEAVLLSMIAFLLSLFLVELLLPQFSALIDKQLAFGFGFAEGNSLFILLFGISLVIGILAGLYPALFLSWFQPAVVLKSESARGGRTSALRRVLVIIQFATTVVFITGTLIVQDQLTFIREKDLGYDSDHIVMLPIFAADRSLSSKREQSPHALTQRFRTVKDVFLRHPDIVSAASMSSFAGSRDHRPDVVRPEGFVGDEWRMAVMRIDEGYFETFGLELVAGRNISPDIPSDLTEAFILNETAVKRLGWSLDGAEPETYAIGKSFGWDGTHVAQGHVIGVVKDFHHLSLHHGIEPLVMCVWQTKIRSLALKIRSGSLERVLPFLESTWGQFVPARPFTHWIYDEGLQNVYRAEQDFGRVFDFASTLALLVSCLGLFGLASFMAHRRTKEVGIRKVLGARTAGMVWLISREFAQMVAISSLIAFPVIYYVMSRWLEAFTYRIGMSPGPFVFGIATALVVALLTVSSQAIRAARSNPADVLRNE